MEIFPEKIGDRILCEEWLQILDELNIGAFTVNTQRQVSSMNLSAQALIGLKDCALTLDGLKKVDAALAQIFGSYTCNELHLNGVGALDVNALKGLAQFKGGVLSLNGLTELTERQAWALSLYTGRLEINGVQHISQAALRSLLGKQRAISMRGIKEVDAYSAAILAKFKGSYLYFYGLEDLDSLATKALASYKGNFMASSAVSALIERYQ